MAVNIGDGEITTNMLADNAVTAAKIANGAVKPKMSETGDLYLVPVQTTLYADLSNVAGSTRSDQSAMLFKSFFREVYFEILPSEYDYSSVIFTIRLRPKYKESEVCQGFVQMHTGGIVVWQRLVETPAYGYPPSLLRVDNNGFRGYILVDWSLFNSTKNIYDYNNSTFLQLAINGINLNTKVIQDLECSPIIKEYIHTHPKEFACSATQFTDILKGIVNPYVPLPAFSVESSGVQNIFICSQTTFDEVYPILSAVNNNAIGCINIIFDGGTYFFNDTCGAHINLSQPTLKDKEINIIGNGSTLIGRNTILQTPTLTDGYYAFPVNISDIYNHVLVDSHGNFITDFYGALHEMTGLVELTDKQPPYVNDFYNETAGNHWTTGMLDNNTETVPTLMRIPNVYGYTSERFCDEVNDCTCTDTFIQIYSGFFSQIYRVCKYTSKYIIAEATPVDGTYVSYQDGSWPQNLIHRIQSCKYPLFRMINYPQECITAYYKQTGLSTGILYSPKNDIVLCDATRFLKIGAPVKSLNVSGLKFRGNKALISEPTNNRATESAGLFYIYSQNNDLNNAGNLATPNNISIKNCEFEHLKSTIIKVDYAANVAIRQNLFQHYYRNGILITSCDSVYVLNNKFINGSLRHNNDGAIVCQHSGFHVAYNRLTNYGYMGIGVGTHYSANLPENNSNSNDTDNNVFVLSIGKGVVEYNELYMTPDYRTRLACVPFMDGGGIYTWTKQHQTIIRYNFVSGHSGLFNNPGIYCDDGSYNVSLFGNMVINSCNYFSIDLRNPSPTPSPTTVYSQNNCLLYNIIDGYYRFEDRHDVGTEDGSFKLRNVLIAEHRSSFDENKTDNLNESKCEHDYYLSGCKIEEWGIAVPSGGKSNFRELNLPEFIMSHIRDAYF